MVQRIASQLRVNSRLVGSREMHSASAADYSFEEDPSEGKLVEISVNWLPFHKEPHSPGSCSRASPSNGVAFLERVRSVFILTSDHLVDWIQIGIEQGDWDIALPSFCFDGVPAKHFERQKVECMNHRLPPCPARVKMFTPLQSNRQENDRDSSSQRCRPRSQLMVNHLVP